MELVLNQHRGIANTEADIIIRAQAGDEMAFEMLYRQNVNRIYCLCLRMVADVSLAEELTQQSFVRAWEMIKGFRRESAFSSWLHRLAVNVVLVEYRSRQRRTARVESSDDLDDFDNIARFSPDQDEAVDLENAIAWLPRKARMILVLHDIEGYMHDEIATMLDIAPGTSKSQLHRAHKLLKEWLQQ